ADLSSSAFSVSRSRALKNDRFALFPSDGRPRFRDPCAFMISSCLIYSVNDIVTKKILQARLGAGIAQLDLLTKISLYREPLGERWSFRKIRASVSRPT